MDWDTQISIEGAATAAGVVGAAIGYIINLIKSWTEQKRRTRVRGTYSTILHLLEEDLVRGLTEDQLWKKYCEPKTAEIRKAYNAQPPEQIDRVQFEARIRDLRLDRLIELVGRDQYRLETQSLDKYDFEHEARGAAVAAAQRHLAPNEVAERALSLLQDTALSSWTRRSALELLLRVSPDEGVKLAKSLLKSANHEEVIMAGEVLAELQTWKTPATTT